MTRDVEINFNHIKFTIISHFTFYVQILRQHQPLHKDLLEHLLACTQNTWGILLKYKIDIVFKMAHSMSWDRH